MKNFVILLALLFSFSCSTIRMQVRSPYKSIQGNGFVTYERSYSVGGGMPLWCGLSAIFYGGACWAYLGMPFVPQEDKIIKDATMVVRTKLASDDVILENPEVKRLSWGSAETFVSYDQL